MASTRGRRPLLQFGLETFQPGAERNHATVKTRERSDGRFHPRPDRQTLNKFIELLCRLCAHDHDEPDSSCRGSTRQYLLFILQLFAQLKARKDELLDKANPLLGTTSWATVSRKPHVNQILHLFSFVHVVRLPRGSSVLNFCPR